MTSPANTVEGPGGRHYTHPRHPERTYMSVTTVISNGVPKNLDNWFKKATATYAVDERRVWEGLERDAAIELIKAECDRIRDAGGSRGTAAHEIAEIAGQLNLDAHHDFDSFRAAALADARHVIVLPGYEGYVDAALKFLWEWRPQIHHTELTVYSHRYDYAGTADLFASVPALGRGLLDYKTSSDIYAETALQLAAYRFADVAVVGTAEIPVPDVDFAAAIHLREDGTYAVVPLACGPAEHRLFLAAKEIATFTTQGYRSVKQPPLVEPPTERPWWASTQRRDWLRGRIEALGRHDSGALELLAQVWPPGVPTFRQSPHHTDEQLAAIAEAVTNIETHVAAPFYEADPDAGPTLGGQPLADKAACTLVAQRLAALPADLAQHAEAAMHAGGYPRLTGGRITVEQLDALEQVLTPLEVEAAQRVHAFRVVLGEFADDTEVASTVALYATGGRSGDVGRLTDDEMERARLLAAGLSSGSLVCMWQDDGTVTFTTPAEVEVRLLAAHGGAKSALLAAGREAAKTLGLPAPRSTAAVVADPLLVARLAAA